MNVPSATETSCLLTGGVIMPSVIEDGCLIVGLASGLDGSPTTPTIPAPKQPPQSYIAGEGTSEPILGEGGDIITPES